MSTRQKMVTVKVPLQYAGVVAGALEFALQVAQNGWPVALARAEDSLRCVGAISDVRKELMAHVHAAQEGKASR